MPSMRKKLLIAVLMCLAIVLSLKVWQKSNTAPQAVSMTTETVPTPTVSSVKKPTPTCLSQPIRPSHFYERNVTTFAREEIFLPFEEAVVNNVHTIVCGVKWFNFRRFLSVLSVMKVHQPRTYRLHYWDNQPIRKDVNDYNLWFEELTGEYYEIIRSSLGSKAPNCKDDVAMTKLIVDVLQNGGIYINLGVVLTESLHELRMNTLSVAVRDKNKPMVFSNIAYVVAKKETLSIEKLEKAKGSGVSCSSSGSLVKTSKIDKETKCVYLESDNMIPASYMESTDALSQLVRLVYYGSKEPKLPSWSMDNPIPNIAHFVLFGGKDMNLVTYLSIKSMIHCVGVDVVYVHVDKLPTGEYYKKLKANEPLIRFTHQEYPEKMFGIRIKAVKHVSNLVRFDVIHKYGGIYVDWDAILLRPLEHLRGYDLVIDVDWINWFPPYPDIINNGVFAAKPGSELLRMTIQKFKKYKSVPFGYSGLMMPYKLYEKYPELVKMQRNLQVICFRMKCHPVTVPGYHNGNQHHLNKASFDWKKVYSMHWTAPDPPELLNMSLLLSTKSMFADIGRYVLSCKREQTLAVLSDHVTQGIV